MGHVWPQWPGRQQRAIGKSVTSIRRGLAQRRASAELFLVSLPPPPCLAQHHPVGALTHMWTCQPTPGHGRSLHPLRLSSAVVPGVLTGLPAALFRAKPAEMCKVHPHVTLMTLCKHTAALLLLLNYHLLPIQASQNNCICSFNAVQMALV